MSAANVAKALQGRPAGQGRYLCPCPVPSHGKGRGDRNPSLQVSDGDDRLLVYCFSGCAATDILAELRNRGLLGGPVTPRQTRRAKRERPAEPEPDPNALALWRASEPLPGTVAEAYLRDTRAVEGDLPPSLRFHRAARYPRTGTAFPALVAAIARPDRKVIAVQITYLRPDGRKAPLANPRLTFGHMGTGAIRLAPCHGAVLGLAEGTETALSAMQISSVPCWSAVGGQRLGRITLSDQVREVHLFADADDAGQRMAERASGIYCRAGRKVRLRFPPDGFKDWNDYAVAMRAGKAAA